MFRRIVAGVIAGVATCACLGLVDGCVTRPVVATHPITNTNFTNTVATATIDKVDLLFDIDNSASMGDKQAYLEKAIPDLLKRLVQPHCVDQNLQFTGNATLSGMCPAGSTAEFPPVHNMHIGIVSSSLGPRLGDACQTDAMHDTLRNTASGPIPRHNDDQAHLLNRTADPNNLQDYTEGTLADAPPPDDFLDWFPPASTNIANAKVQFTGPSPVSVGPGDGSILNRDFQQLVVGVHDFGCGIESQLESWYRFLVQPDPYASLALDKDQHAQWVGVDTTILAQRADFLRPDSLVAVIVLTDENDSEVDVRSFGGTAWRFMISSTGTNPFFPPRGTSICQTKPMDPACTSCAFHTNPSDPQCTTEDGTYRDPTDWGADLNLRHVHEKQKYGVSVQFPIERYVLGLTSPRVPDRTHEYPPAAKSYAGLDPSNLSCTNPLYAASLPRPPPGSSSWNPTADELCKLTPGPRKRKLVFYGHIGGVPHQLLQVDPTKPDSPQKDKLTADDWQLILGKDPESLDYTGIDPHMVESYNQRTNVPVPTSGFKVADQSQPQNTDPIAGREWQTDSTTPLRQGPLVDREYACIFKLDQPRDCRDAVIMTDDALSASCDCASPMSGGVFTHAQVPAVCDDANPRMQDFAKAYPTIRELDLARLLGKVPDANEGIISSLCPIHTTDMSPDHMSDPLYGYRPAMNAIVKALGSALKTQCLPNRLDIDEKVNPPRVPCLVLGTFPGPPGAQGVPAQCSDVEGDAFTDAEPSVLQEFKKDRHAAWVQGGSSGPDPSLNLICEVKQVTPNTPCNVDGESGWCYFENSGNSEKCAQELRFSPTALASGVIMSLQCLEASEDLLADGGGD
jgi:hypothetical protein